MTKDGMMLLTIILWFMLTIVALLCLYTIYYLNGVRGQRLPLMELIYIRMGI